MLHRLRVGTSIALWVLFEPQFVHELIASSLSCVHAIEPEPSSPREIYAQVWTPLRKILGGEQKKNLANVSYIKV